MEVHLITGCSGFVGHALTEKLLALGHKVKGVDLVAPPHTISNKIDFHQACITDENQMRSLCKGVDVVHHLAAVVPLIRDKRVIYRVNVDGSASIARAARYNNVKKFVFCSSSAIFSNLSNVNNNSTPDAFESYGQSKILAESAITNLLENTETSYSIIRPRTILGPGRLGIFSLLFEWIRKNKPVYIAGDGSNIMQLLHIQDYCENHVRLSTSGTNVKINLASPDYPTLRGLIESLIQNANSSSVIRTIPIFVFEPLMFGLSALRISPYSIWHSKALSKSIVFDDSNYSSRVKFDFSSEQSLISAYQHYIKNPQLDESPNQNSSTHRKPIQSWFTNLLVK